MPSLTSLQTAVLYINICDFVNDFRALFNYPLRSHSALCVGCFFITNQNATASALFFDGHCA